MNKNIVKIISDFNKLKEFDLSNFGILKEAISHWSVAEHIEHILKVDNSSLSLLEKGMSSQELKPLTFNGRIVLLIGFIPRGAAKAPTYVMPTKLAADKIILEIDSTLKRFQSLPQNILTSDIQINHPLLGKMNPKQWLRFLAIHQTHHLKIIRDIIKK